ncbi:hypothetical protein EDEG_03426 [Edhazardia aedis USNM 41457]|uniref:RNB domain-containing protein n=1 Tax=Edhazardia aedis (strain USNM 41457) TaxID=1003232 RepID=J9DHP3_EDHAE|nr:hypothetical protein EDEG_03426 [Edhazardia aedis USNM 41457]|eukprot:EJW02130.1 hypothetical protein EDEG_03426 [Edhazardia aedis USNM 41457]
MKIVTSTHKLNRYKRLVKSINTTYLRPSIPCGFQCCDPFFYKNTESSNNNSNKDDNVYLMPTLEVLKNYTPLFLVNNVVDCILLQSVINSFRSSKSLEIVENYYVFNNEFCLKTYVSEKEAANFEKKQDENISNVSDFNNSNNIQSENINSSNNTSGHTINNLSDDQIDELFSKTSVKGKTNSDNDSNNINNENIHDYINNMNNYSVEDFSSPLEYLQFAKALKFYTTHTKFRFLILTSSTISQLPFLYPNKKAQLNDLLIKSQKEETKYLPYYSEDKLSVLKQEGRVFQGTLYTNTFNCFSGIVHCKYQGKNVRVRVIGRNDTNRAMNLDTVYVEIKESECSDLIDNEYEYKNGDRGSLNSFNHEIDYSGISKVNATVCSREQSINSFIKDEKTSVRNKNDCVLEPSKKHKYIKENRTIYENENNNSDNNTNKQDEFNSKIKVNKMLASEVCGRVVGISKKARLPIIGTITRASSNYAIVTPLDRKLPNIRINTIQSSELLNQRILCRVVDWDVDSFYPLGVYIRRIGSVGDLDSEIEGVKVSCGIDYSNYKIDEGLCCLIRGLQNKLYINSMINNNSSNDIDASNVNDIKDVLDRNNNSCNNVNNTFVNSKYHESWSEKEKEVISLYNKLLNVEKHKRLDIRDTSVFSIDPEGCTDIDDAVSLVDKGDCLEIGVHIADVSYFVLRNTYLDNESKNRGTTVYLTDRRFEMLPNVLSSNLCSLRENEDRFAFSVFWVVDKKMIDSCDILTDFFDLSLYKNNSKISTDLNIVNHNNNANFINNTDIKMDFRLPYSDNLPSMPENIIKFTDKSPIRKVFFAKTIIRSKKSYTYQEAQNEINNKTGNYEILSILNEFSKKLRKERFKNGALELNSSEIKINFRKKMKEININNLKSIEQKENTRINKKENLPVVESIEHKVVLETCSLIEELMLLANITVAKAVYARNPKAVLRRHPKFADDSFTELKEYLMTKNIDLDYLTSKQLNNSIKGIKDEQLKNMIKKVVTRSMNQAVYFCAENHPFEDFLHYGLAFPIYTHFTSPIRRYADILVHRQLEDILDDCITNTKSDNYNVYNNTTNNNNFDKNCNINNITNTNEFNNNIKTNNNSLFKSSTLYLNDNCEFCKKFIENVNNPDNTTLSTLDIEDICRNINYRNRNSMIAGLEIDKLYTYLYLKNIKNTTTTGFITKIRKNGIVLNIQELNIEETVHIQNYDYNEDKNCFSKDNKPVFCLYDNVKVEVKENDDLFFVHRKFDVSLIQ